MERTKVLVSGYVSLDRMIHIDAPMQTGRTSLVTNQSNEKLYYGGCSVNIAVALNRMGIPAMPLIRVGDDYEKTGLKEFLSTNGIPVEGVILVEGESTSCSYLIQDGDNCHVTLFYEGAMAGRYACKLPDQYFEEAGLGVMTVGAEADNRQFLSQCIKHNLPLIFGMKGDCKAFPAAFLKDALKASSLIFMNEEELGMVGSVLGYPVTDLLSSKKTRAIVVTMGEEGSRCMWMENGIREVRIPACRSLLTVDTSGAGDAFLAGFLYGFLERKSWLDCGMLGSVLSWFVLQEEGCCTNLPQKAEAIKKYGGWKESMEVSYGNIISEGRA